MMPTNKVFAAYEKLLAHSTRMLAFARKEEWSRLAEEESAYAVEVEALKGLGTPEEYDKNSLRRKAGLLERILEQDAETRRHLEKHRTEIGDLMDDSRRRRDLSRAYQTAGIDGASGRQGLQ
ncbi:flagellar protein FliT [Halomonas sp. GXIMD04776]|uniref:flagellar protein FliT n=1 Tax=Halomonas sp. GXIMD04776 TaxID=3415605 RepID=UPI003C921B47